MDNVSDISKFKNKKELEDQRTVSGAAQCLQCSHKWIAVVPAGEETFDCPACKICKGVFSYPVRMTRMIWHCTCDCTAFQLARDGAMCMSCGKQHYYADLANG